MPVLEHFDADEIRFRLNQKPGQSLLAEAFTDGQMIGATHESLTPPHHAYLEGHTFADKVVIPGVLQVRMIRDAAALYALVETGVPYAVSTIDAKFRGGLTPEDHSSISISHTSFEDDVLLIKGQVLKSGEKKPAAMASLVLKPFNPQSQDGVVRVPFNRRATEIILEGEDLDPFMPQRGDFRLVDALHSLKPGLEGVGTLVNTDASRYDYLKMNLGGIEYLDPIGLTEGAAQVGTAVGLSMPQNRGLVPLFGGISKLNVHGLLVPGEGAYLGVKVDQYKEAGVGKRGGIGRGSINIVRLNGDPVMQGELSFIVADPETLEK